MRSHFPCKELGYAVGFVCLLLALYVGAYFAIVQRGDGIVDHDAEQEVDETVTRDDGTSFTRKARQTITFSSFIVVAKYPFGGAFGATSLRAFFSPIHDLDRRLRTEFWNDLDAVLQPAPPATVVE
jgi:hypothetical protein